MADGELTLKIDQALADSLRARAEAAGQSVEEYALNRLQPDDTTLLQGFNERDTAYWDEVQRICDETERDGGIPLEDVERWMRSWRTDNVLPPPEPRPRIRE